MAKDVLGVTDIVHAELVECAPAPPPCPPPAPLPEAPEESPAQRKAEATVEQTGADPPPEEL